MKGLEYILLVSWGLSLSLVFLGTWFAQVHFRKDRQKKHTPTLNLRDPITILKPIKGMDEGLEINLRTFFDLDYPEYEIILSVADAQDPAIPLIQKLMACHPEIPSRLMIGDIKVGPNPKVNNMVRSYGEAKHDWILISDSNIRVDRDYLKTLTSSLKHDTGLLTAAVFADMPEDFGGKLEAQHLNAYVTRWMSLSKKLGHPLVLGKSMLVRKSLLDRCGGLKIIGKFLAEDYMAGRAIEKLGYKVEIMSQPVRQHLGKYPVKTFWSRHLRWGRIRKSHNRLAFFLEPFNSALGSGLVGTFTVSSFLGMGKISFFLSHLLLWNLLDLAVHWRLGVRPKPTSPFYWLLKETLILVLWIQSLLGSKIKWRGTQYQLLSGGRLA